MGKPQHTPGMHPHGEIISVKYTNGRTIVKAKVGHVTLRYVVTYGFAREISTSDRKRIGRNQYRHHWDLVSWTYRGGVFVGKLEEATLRPLGESRTGSPEDHDRYEFTKDSKSWDMTRTELETLLKLKLIGISNVPAMA